MNTQTPPHELPEHDVLDLTFGVDVPLSTSVSMKLEDEDTWDITDTTMDDLLCNMTITAEKNQGEHMAGNNDSMFGNSDMDMMMDMDDEPYLPLEDYFFTSATTSTNKAPSCDWIWADLEQAIYDADNTGYGDDAIKMDTNGGDDDDLFDFGDVESTIGQDIQANASRLPNLIQWLHDHVDTIVE
ncbi:unnamed protein product [Absidia cylindrospora]